MTGGWFFSRQWLGIKFFLLLCAAVAFHAFIYRDLEGQRNLMASRGFDSVRLEVLSRIEKEFQQVFESATLYVDFQERVTLPQVEEKLDIFWSRVEIGSSKSYGEVYGSRNVDVSIVAALQKDLPKFEMAVKGLRQGDETSLMPLYALWRQYHVQMSDFSDNSYAVRTARLQEGNVEQWNLFAALTRFQNAFTAYGAVLMTLLLAELFWGSRIVRSLGAKNEENLRLASTDHLTSLHNRRAFHRELSQRLNEPDRPAFALLLINVDRFSAVNRSFGHATGDRILIEVGSRINETAGKCHVSRVAGDEFAVLVDGDAGAAGQLAERILRYASRPLDVGDRFYEPSLSISICPDAGAQAGDTEKLLQRANAALMEAKQKGGARSLIFVEEMMVEFKERQIIEADLAAAIDNNAIEIMVQPKVQVSDGKICGYEALARWQHPEIGWISPEKFCRVADSIGLSSTLGLAVAELAFAVAASLKVAGHGAPMSINISPAFASHPHFVANIHALAIRNGILPQDIELEITEEAMLSDFGIIRQNMKEMYKSGARIAIDDFGKGYSNINRLTTLAANVIKVDKEAVENVVEDPRSRAIIRSIVGLANELGIEVIVEGVEQQAQADILAGLGVERIQGYLISRPLQPLRLMSWVEEWRSTSQAKKRSKRTLVAA